MANRAWYLEVLSRYVNFLHPSWMGRDRVPTGVDLSLSKLGLGNMKLFLFSS